MENSKAHISIVSSVSCESAPSQVPLATLPDNDKVKSLQQLENGPTGKSLRFKLTVFFLCLISVVAAMDAVIVASCLAAIAASLKCTSVEAFWVGTSFLLAQTVTIPLYGTASEIFGRKWCIIPAIALFLFGSILCATAQNVNWLIGARVAQGVGAGGITQLVQVILSDITMMHERALYIAMSMAAWAVGTNIGVPIGGAIGSYASWRLIFWINVPFCVVAMVGLYFSLTLKRDKSSLSQKLARVDYLGMALFIAAATLFLVGVTSGGVSDPWGSAAILAPMIIGVMLFGVFFYVEGFVAKEPMMPLRIFNDRTAIAGFTTSFFQGMVIWCYTYYLVIFFLGALQHGLFHSSVETLSVGAYIAPSAVVASIIVKRTQRFKYIIIAGWVLLAVGMGVNTTMAPDSSKAVLYGPRCLAAIGAGLLFPTPLFAVQAAQLAKDTAIATSTQVFARSLGTTFGVALGGVIFQNRWRYLLAPLVADGHIPPSLAISSNLAEVAYAVIRTFPAPVQAVYRRLFADSLDMVWYVMCGVSVVGLLFALAARNERLQAGEAAAQAFDDAAGRGTPETDVESVVGVVTEKGGS